MNTEQKKILLHLTEKKEWSIIYDLLKLALKEEEKEFEEQIQAHFMYFVHKCPTVLISGKKYGKSFLHHNDKTLNGRVMDYFSNGKLHLDCLYSEGECIEYTEYEVDGTMRR
jgi:hypothetical protein